MGKRRSKSPKLSSKIIIILALFFLAIGSFGSNKDDKKELSKKDLSQQEQRIDENKSDDNKGSKSENNSKKNKPEKKENKLADRENKNNHKGREKDLQKQQGQKTHKKNPGSTERPENLTFDFKRDVPEYSGKPSCVVNNDKPYFEKTKNTRVYKNYSNLDRLNRVGVCELVTGPEYLPREKRTSITIAIYIMCSS